MTALRARGRSVAIIRFDADQTTGLRCEQVDHLAYHISRLLTGEGTAASEWRHLGLSIEIEPDTDGGDEGTLADASHTR